MVLWQIDLAFGLDLFLLSIAVKLVVNVLVFFPSRSHVHIVVVEFPSKCFIEGLLVLLPLLLIVHHEVEYVDAVHREIG